MMRPGCWVEMTEPEFEAAPMDQTQYYKAMRRAMCLAVWQ